AILLHKIPEAFALATVLFFSIRNKVITLSLLGLFTIMTPLGSYIGEVITSSHMLAYNRLIAIVCGSLIHISTTIIFEASGKAHKISLYKLGAILVGAGIALAGVWTESH
ncbi:MAG: ZIP family metal transporter, partial [Chitinophagales bacterium]|nr:ZIP family metal transporter [Chitinophagales bacterium]